jgi:hypothetical protein
VGGIAGEPHIRIDRQWLAAKKVANIKYELSKIKEEISKLNDFAASRKWLVSFCCVVRG